MSATKTYAGINGKTRTRRPRMLVRYGYGDRLVRAITLEMNSNVSCTGGALHLISGVVVATGRPCSFYITDAQLPKYTHVTGV